MSPSPQPGLESVLVGLLARKQRPPHPVLPPERRVPSRGRVPRLSRRRRGGEVGRLGVHVLREVDVRQRRGRPGGRGRERRGRLGGRRRRRRRCLQGAHLVSKEQGERDEGEERRRRVDDGRWRRKNVRWGQKGQGKPKKSSSTSVLLPDSPEL